MENEVQELLYGDKVFMLMTGFLVAYYFVAWVWHISQVRIERQVTWWQAIRAAYK